MEKRVQIGDSVEYAHHHWLVVDVHGYPVQRVDLRRTVIMDPRRRFMDESESKRDVPVNLIKT
jgi:hypothetical protein